MRDAEDLLLNAGSAGSKGIAWESIGQIVTGTILEHPVSRQQTDMATKKPKFFKSGDPMMQVLIKLQTDLRDPENQDDDGVRTLYAKNLLLKAIGKAMVEAGVKKIEPGGFLKCKFTEKIPSGQPQPYKQFVAQYTPPAVQQASDVFAQAAAQPDFPEQAPRTSGTVFENQHRAVDANQRPQSTLDQMRNASQAGQFTNEIPF